MGLIYPVVGMLQGVHVCLSKSIEHLIEMIFYFHTNTYYSLLQFYYKQ